MFSFLPLKIILFLCFIYSWVQFNNSCRSLAAHVEHKSTQLLLKIQANSVRCYTQNLKEPFLQSNHAVNTFCHTDCHELSNQLSEVILGKVNPSATLPKLQVTMAYNRGQIRRQIRPRGLKGAPDFSTKWQHALILSVSRHLHWTCLNPFHLSEKKIDVLKFWSFLFSDWLTLKDPFSNSVMMS